MSEEKQMPKKLTISLFTPNHDNKYMMELYESIKDQDFDEWVIVHNNGGEPLSIQDARVKQHIIYKAPEWVGPLKAAACKECTGDILIEMDHDDMLMPTAIEEVRAAFADPEVGFVYSNTIHMLQTGDAKAKVQRFDERYGWTYREVEFQGLRLDEHHSFPPTPESISRIWFAPNHLRAFRRSVYEAIGGYNPDMRILDDLDLMCRMYLATKFVHIDKGLYVYRVHGENTWLKYNAEIQENVYRIYDQYAEALAERQADLQGLKKVELGGRMNAKEGYETVDLKDAAVIADLDGPWPFEDSSVGVIRAMDVLEHLKDPIHAMKEAARVLAPGGWFIIQVPSTDGRGAFQDPTHKSFWNENSFWYYTRADKAKYIDTPVRFQAPRLLTTEMNPEKVCWVRTHLINMKDGYRPCGEVSI